MQSHESELSLGLRAATDFQQQSALWRTVNYGLNRAGPSRELTQRSKGLPRRAIYFISDSKVLRHFVSTLFFRHQSTKCSVWDRAVWTVCACVGGWGRVGVSIGILMHMWVVGLCGRQCGASMHVWVGLAVWSSVGGGRCPCVGMWGHVSAVWTVYACVDEWGRVDVSVDRLYMWGHVSGSVDRLC